MSLFKISCYSEIPRHKFEPRYDFKFPEISTGGGCTIITSGKKDIMNRIYVCDVCVHCGKTSIENVINVNAPVNIKTMLN